MKRLAAAVVGLALSVSLTPTAQAQSLAYIDGIPSRVFGSVATGLTTASADTQLSVSDAVVGSTGMKREWQHGVHYDVVAYVADLGEAYFPPTRCSIKIVIDPESALNMPNEWWLHQHDNGWFYPFTGNEIEYYNYEPWDNWRLPTSDGFTKDIYFRGTTNGQHNRVGDFDISIPEECPVPDGQTELLLASGWAKRME